MSHQITNFTEYFVGVLFIVRIKFDLLFHCLWLKRKKKTKIIWSENTQFKMYLLYIHLHFVSKVYELQRDIFHTVMTKL